MAVVVVMDQNLVVDFVDQNWVVDFVDQNLVVDFVDRNLVDVADEIHRQSLDLAVESWARTVAVVVARRLLAGRRMELVMKKFN